METSNKLIGEQLSLWTSSVVDTPANRSALQDSAKEQTIQDTCGHGYEQPLANYNLDTQSWRMCVDISLWEEHKSLESLPKSGMTQNGVLYQQPEWVRPIDEIASSLWPTPTTQEVEHPNAELTPTGRRKSKDGKTSHSLGLADAVQMWPTPVSSSSMAEDISTVQARLRNGKPYKSRLIEAVAMWPTPRAAQSESRNHTVYAREYGKPQNLENRIAQREPSAIGGKLNPNWVEWLMGFPIGWTDLKD
jgi:phage-related protein